MIINFEPMKVITEFPSYLLNDGNLEMKIGTVTKNFNIVTNNVELPWKLKDVFSNVILSGRISVILNTFETKINFANLEIDKIYVFEIESIGGYISKTTIYRGSINSFQIIDENFTFNDNNQNIQVIGDAKIVGRKVKLIDDWDINRTVGNAIIIHNTQKYIFSPSKIFTRKTGVNQIINFKPFLGFPEREVKIYIIPKIEHVSPFHLSISPPTRINIKFMFKKFRKNPVDDFLEQYDYQPVENFDTNQKISTINLLALNTNFTHFEIEACFDI